ncbi:hypothetical protein [Paenibacillus senegalensis]|uniref:hypothetical protein n=1 Tax=Paenibacillus senegalensis TaxID=1465766 RepID=UPI000288CB02|nr:hypothetical protein [Paenibacillus senegalensis]
MIVTSYLNDIAQYTEGKIHKVVLNDIYEITQFENKDMEDKTVFLKYMVPENSVTHIEKIELQTSNNEVISRNLVSIPITADTVLLQYIEVKEV